MARRTIIAKRIAAGATVAGGIIGSVMFFSADGVITQDNPNLFWDDTNNRLGIGTTTPSNTLTVDGDTEIADGYGLIIGASSLITAHAETELQILGTAGADSGMTLARFSDNIYQPHIEFVKSRSTTIGGNAIVQDNDVLGGIHWHPDDGVDYDNHVASFIAQVDDISPAQDDIGAEFTWSLMPGGGDAIRNVMKLRASGNLGIGTDLPSAMLSITNIGSNPTAYFEDEASDTSPFIIDADGNVGIGTSTPFSKLSLSDIGDVTLIIEADSNNSGGEDDNPTVLLSQDGDAVQGLLGITGNAGTRYTSALGNALFMEAKSDGVLNAIQFVTGGTPYGTDGTARLTINVDGDIGIGTTTSDVKLTIADDSWLGHLKISRTQGGTEYNAQISIHPDEGYMALVGGLNIDKIWVEQGSNFIVEDKVGIGTSTPATPLDIFSTATTTITIDSNSVTQGGCLKMKDINGGGYSYGTALNGVITWSTVSCE